MTRFSLLLKPPMLLAVTTSYGTRVPPINYALSNDDPPFVLREAFPADTSQDCCRQSNQDEPIIVCSVEGSFHYS